MSDEYVYGLHAVQAMLERAPRRVRQLLVQRGRLDARIQAVLELAASESVEVDRVLPEELDRLADGGVHQGVVARVSPDRKSTRLNSSHVRISYAVFCLKKKNEMN